MKRLSTLLTFLCLAIASASAQPAYSPSIQKESLGRGLVAIRQDDGHVAVTWRLLASDGPKTTFQVYRDGQLLTKKPLGGATYYIDDNASTAAATYEVRPAGKKASASPIGRYTLPAEAPIGYIGIPLDKPDGGTTPAGDRFDYTANDASVGDVDGDGEYEIILKWEPTNAHDNAHDGYTGGVLFDCYRLNGERLWRIDLGPNIRAGAHYTQFMVFDLDGDNRAEVVMKTSDGTIDGRGTIIGDPFADYRHKGDVLSHADEIRQDSIDEANMRAREQQMRDWFTQDSLRRVREGEKPIENPFAQFANAPRRAQDGGIRGGNARQSRRKRTSPRQGRILTGNEYLTVFSGLTGEALQTIDYVPARGNLADWGDTKANRSERYLACIAYLDGQHPSVVMCRGYYTRAVLAAFDWDGRELRQRWVFDSSAEGYGDYSGQGNHNLRVADVDGDGCDEIIYGSCAIDHDGTGLYSTGLGHGDAMHLTAFLPGDRKLQVWQCHETKGSGSTLRDAATGEILCQIPAREDVGRCMAADIDPTSPGVEMWSIASGGLLNSHGEVLCERVPGLSINMAVWWDGDLLRELLDGTRVSKYDWQEGACNVIFDPEGVSRNNGSKSNPCLQGDLVGDWREEILARTADSRALRLYVTPIPTDHRAVTFMDDIPYRISVATQNVAYNQPTQPGFYFGPDKQ